MVFEETDEHRRFAHLVPIRQELGVRGGPIVPLDQRERDQQFGRELIGLALDVREKFVSVRESGFVRALGSDVVEELDGLVGEEVMSELMGQRESPSVLVVRLVDSDGLPRTIELS